MPTVDMFKCSLCDTHYQLRDLDIANEELGVYICSMGKGCLIGKKYQINEDAVPYHSLKVRVVDE